MAFEWDQTKNRQNLAKHGFDFMFAVRLFDGPVRRHIDLRPRDEPRIVATGRVEGRFITVVYTRRNGRIASFPPDLPGQMRGSDAE
jgi:uncharacterized DUF497 family protein